MSFRSDLLMPDSVTIDKLQGNRMKITILHLLFAVSLPISGYQEKTFQYDGNAGYVRVASKEDLDSNGSEGFTGNSRFHAVKSFSDNFTLNIDHFYRGVTDKSLFPENYYPSENVTSGGLTISALGDLYLGYSNTQYLNAKPTPMPWYKNDTKVQPRSLNTFEGIWDLNADWFHLYTTISSFVNRFELVHADPFVYVTDNQVAPYGDHRDADLWLQSSAGMDLPIELRINGSFFLKNDLNGNNHYNMNEFRLGVSGDRELSRRRIILSFGIYERFLQSPMMRESGYADGFATDANLRIQLKLNSKLFIKAATSLTIAPGMFKQYYELQLRKTWDEHSSLNIAYFATNGVLFPRHGLQAGTSIRLTDHFGITPSIAGYMQLFPYESVFRFYRSDYGLELFFPINDRIEIYSNAKFMAYNNHALFAPRFFISSGIRAW